MRVRHLILMGVALITGCQSERPQPGAIAKEWAVNTSQMGIKPVYPLTEMSPGDVFLSVGYKVDSIADIPSSGFDIQPIIYSSLNLTGVPSHEQEKGRFKYPVDTSPGSGSGLKALPDNSNRANCSVAFPGFSFASTLDYNLGANIPTSVWGAIFSGGHKSNYSVSYSVPRSQCARVQVARLMPIATRYLQGLEPEQVTAMKNASLSLAIPESLKEKYDARPIVVIPYVVYNADSLDVTINSLDGTSAKLSAAALSMVELSEKKQALEARIRQLGGQPVSPGSEGAEGGEGKPEPEASGEAEDGTSKQAAAEDGAGAGGPEESQSASAGQEGQTPESANSAKLNSLQAQLASVEKQLDATVKSGAPSLPGVTGSVTRISATGITLHQVFNPPLAIGYRALHFELPSYAGDLAKANEQHKEVFLRQKIDLELGDLPADAIQQIRENTQPREIYYSPLK